MINCQVPSPSKNLTRLSPEILDIWHNFLHKNYTYSAICTENYTQNYSSAE